MRTLYQCDICGNVYKVAALARRCEAFQLPAPPLQVGQAINIVSRYDGDQPDLIQKITIEATYAAHLMAEWEADREELADNEDFQTMHQYIYHVKEDHEIRKEHWSTAIPAWAIRELGGCGYWGDQ